jgi:hypothetical protein
MTCENCQRALIQIRFPGGTRLVHRTNAEKRACAEATTRSCPQCGLRQRFVHFETGAKWAHQSKNAAQRCQRLRVEKGEDAHRKVGVK